LDEAKIMELHAHPDPSLWIIESPGITSGESLAWFVEQFRPHEKNPARTYSLLDTEVEGTPPGANGLIFLPNTSGSITPEWNAHARGAFLGFSLAHTRGHFERSIQEGLSFYLRDLTTRLERMGLPVDKIIAAGGGAKSSVWCEIKSDITKKPVLVPRMRAVSAYGSAMIAAVGTKHLSSLKAASEEWVKYDRTFHPTKSHEKTYDRLYEAYTSAYWSLKGLFNTLSEMQAEQ
jgi:xylulokinase